MSNNNTGARAMRRAFHQMPAYVITETTCVHCGDKLTPDQVKVTGPGGKQAAGLVIDPHQRFSMFLQLLVQHALTRHPEKTSADFMRGQAFGTVLMIGNHYRSPDEDLTKYRDQIRHMVHELSRKNKVSDSTIEAKVKELGLHSLTDEQLVIELITQFRYVYEERGLYPELELGDSDPTKVQPDS